MSTQRRESRSTPARKNCRRGPRNRWQRTSCTGRAAPRREPRSTPVLRHASAFANGRTALPGTPAEFLPNDETGALWASSGTLAYTATDSLQSGYRIVELVSQDVRRGSPPSGARPILGNRPAARRRSSLPPIPSPSGSARLHPSLPRVSAGLRRRAERYDGKRDMHLQHTA